MTVIPKAITSKTEVYYLNMFNMLDLRDIESSGIRNIKNMKNLQTLELSSCYLDRYIKEFNDLPKLTSLKIHPGPSDMWNYFDINTSFFEVDKINPNITNFDFLDDWVSGERRTVGMMIICLEGDWNILLVSLQLIAIVLEWISFRIIFMRWRLLHGLT